MLTSVEDSNQLDLDAHVARESGYGYGRTRRPCRTKRSRVHLIHLGEIRHITKKDRGLDDVRKITSCGREHRRQILYYLFGLFGDRGARDLHRLRMERDLTGREQKAVGLHRLCVWADRGGRVVRV